jgi:hypothetical protein
MGDGRWEMGDGRWETESKRGARAGGVAVGWEAKRRWALATSIRLEQNVNGVGRASSSKAGRSLEQLTVHDNSARDTRRDLKLLNPLCRNCK